MIKRIFRYLNQHKRKIRLTYWLIVVLAFIFIVLPVFFFFYLFNEDQVKQLIVEQFDNNNYHVEVVGHVAPKFWHGLSLDFEDVEVDTKGYDTLFKIKHMSCQLSWIDLAFAKYKIRRMALNDVEINETNLLKTNTANILNLSNQRIDVFNRLRKFEVFNIHSVGNKIPYKLSEGSVRIKQSGNVVSFELGFKLDDQNTYVLTRGNLANATNTKIDFNDFQLRLYNGQSFQLKLNSSASYDISKQSLELSQATGTIERHDYKGKIQADSLSFSLAQALANNLKLNIDYGNELIKQNVQIAVNQLVIDNYTQLSLDKINLKYTAGYENNKVELISNLNDIKYAESATSITASSCENQVNLFSPNFATGKFSGTLSGICTYLPKQNLLNLDFTGELNGAPLKLKMKLYNKAKPYLILSGSMDDLDLSRIEVNHDKFLPLLYDKSSLPFAWLSLINVDGNLIIKHFALDRINLNNLVTEFSVENSALNINKIRADVYKGVLNGRARVEKVGQNTYNISSKQVINGVNLQDMFNDLFDVQAISGQANLVADITASNLHSYDDLYHNLNGNISIGATNGAFQGVDFNLFVNPDGMNLTSKRSTAFEQLKSTFNFTNGVSRAGQINFSSKYVIASGGGLVDFDNSKINYTLSIKSALPHNDEKINSVLIPVTVSGDLFSPKVNIKNIHLYTTDIVKPGSQKKSSTHKHVKKKHSN